MTDKRRQSQQHLDRPVAGADLPREERPGVPMEHEPRPLTPTAPVHFEHMRPRRGLTHRAGVHSMTPVFGTAQPLRGLSGLLRRIAYSTGETRARHWMMLLLADRVDVLEHRVARLVKLAALLPVGAAAAVLALRLLRSD
jgi:hypothetical protein